MAMWGVKTRGLWHHLQWGVVGIFWCASVGALPLGPLPATPGQEAEDAADLADASADSTVLRSLSANARKALAEKATGPDAPADTAAKVASSPAASKPERSLVEEARSSAKNLVVESGVVGAKEFLSAELGLDKAADSSGDALAESRHALRQSPSAHADSAGTGSPSEEGQSHWDKEKISFLASALAREVVPWAIGGAALLFGIQGIRLLLAYAHRKNERKRVHRQSRRTARHRRS